MNSTCCALQPILPHPLLSGFQEHALKCVTDVDGLLANSAFYHQATDTPMISERLLLDFHQTLAKSICGHIIFVQKEISIIFLCRSRALILGVVIKFVVIIKIGKKMRNRI